MQAETSTARATRERPSATLEELLARRARLVEELQETNERIESLNGPPHPSDPAFTEALTAHFHRAKRNALAGRTPE
jgi:hypothetical protein